MKKVPIAVEEFKKIIEENYYYIDKTKFIEDVLNDGAEVKLFCRPRRFGKTLNMSTLKYFFDIENKDENRKLFNGLYIENSPLIDEQGKLTEELKKNIAKAKTLQEVEDIYAPYKQKKRTRATIAKEKAVSRNKPTPIP